MGTVPTLPVQAPFIAGTEHPTLLPFWTVSNIWVDRRFQHVTDMEALLCAKLHARHHLLCG